MQKEIKEQKPFEVGLNALATERTADALAWFRKALEAEESPLTCSYLAYCLAKEDGLYKEGIALCMTAIRDEPKNPEIYLNLGRIYMLSGHKRSALRAFQLGLRYGGNPQILNELTLLGRRKSPPIPFLSRDSAVNIMLGKLLKKLRLR